MKVTQCHHYYFRCAAMADVSGRSYTIEELCTMYYVLLNEHSSQIWSDAQLNNTSRKYRIRSKYIEYALFTVYFTKLSIFQSIQSQMVE
jgi:hypothetical protein